MSDENGDKSGPHDQRRMREARLEGRQPVAVTDHAATLTQAVHGAAQKLAHLLDSAPGAKHTMSLRLKAGTTPEQARAIASSLQASVKGLNRL